jgi:hypothetical protein
MFKLSSFNSASMIFLSLIGDNDPRFAPTCPVIDDHYYLSARGMQKQESRRLDSSSVSMNLRFKNMWVALLVFPLGFCSLFEAAQVLTKSSSTGSLLRYYRSFLLQVYDLVNIDLFFRDCKAGPCRCRFQRPRSQSKVLIKNRNTILSSPSMDLFHLFTSRCTWPLNTAEFFPDPTLASLSSANMKSGCSR